jgi:hypothetical protein
VTEWASGSGAANTFEPPPVTDSSNSNSHATTGPITRAQKVIRRPRVYTDGTVWYGKHGFLTHCDEPYSFDDALTNKHGKNAMDLEYDALIKNGTWHLVPPIKRRNIVE